MTDKRLDAQDRSALGLIERLSNAPGAPGFEDDVLAVLRDAAGPASAVTEDSVRNLYIRGEGLGGNGPVVMLDAHTDEVAFMVQAIKPNGTLRFVPLGGWVPNTVPAHRVLVRDADGRYIPGVIASKPPHFMTEAEKAKPLDIEDMAIDVGATSKAEAEDVFRVRIGEPVVPDADFRYDAGRDLMTGKAFDCRLGCAAVIETMRRASGLPLRVGVVGALASQEEVGMRGAGVTARAVNPAAAIVFEGCPADDTFADDYMVQTALKRGPMLRFIDRMMITNPRFQRFALDLGAELGIPVQASVRSGGATDGGPIHLSGPGVPVIVIGLPVRYIHTHYGIASYADFDNAVRLALAVLSRLDEATIRGF
ncbi:MAG: M42 family peptidase [Spirochaetaceae bacterium]|nr:M42 family peptidase [Spirochaetaceae bacterium]